MKTAIRVAIILTLTFALVSLGRIPPVQAEFVQEWTTRDNNPGKGAEIDPVLETILAAAQPEDQITVIVKLKSQADLSRIGGPNRDAHLRGVVRALQAHAEAAQRDIKGLAQARKAQGLVSRVAHFWVFNGLSVTATRDVIYELAAHPDVLKITPDEISIVPATRLAQSTAAWNLSVVNAPALWELGYYGQGIVIASMDSGVDLNHPDLNSRWRGGSNSWLDPYGEHPFTPTDLTGHGTWTMGVMVAGDASGTSLGLAPLSQWIAVKIFNDSGSATATAIHQGFQWLLDPDGNPNTADAPHVVNNSWTFSSPGCDLEFEQDLQALRAAGILPVFAAGNGGPYPATSYSPANNPSAFAVGATDNYDNIYFNSSRGPSSCGEAESVYPELVAPGVGIYTTERYGLYTTATGTSLSAPHVSGGLALLLSAFPSLTGEEHIQALTDSAVDLGLPGPDNDFGYGRLDALGAFLAIQAGGGTPVPTMTATSTATPTPTAVPPTLTPTPTYTPEPATNLAIGKPVEVSSFADDSHTGAMAVDGYLATYWQSKKAVGKKAPTSEWIKVDLQNSAAISQVVLEWEAYYASSYTLLVSSDDLVWSTVYSTSSGDGNADTISLNTVSARYVMLESTVWNDSSLRTWLREFQVLGVVGGSSPTATPMTPTPTATETPVIPTPTLPAPTATLVVPTPTPTHTPIVGSSVHVGDLDGLSSPSRNRWDAEVIVSLHDAGELPFPGAIVSGSWSGGASGSDSCVTDNAGQCSILLSGIKSNVFSVTFSITDVSAGSSLYRPDDNHDPDGDSDGTSITLMQP
jgi:subtilisin family serine protease